MIRDTQKYMVLRYSTTSMKDCIEQHISILNDNGYCWFGKIGAVPSKMILDSVYREKKPAIVLYGAINRKKAAFLCRTDIFTTEKPTNGYPKYYDDLDMSIFFRLLSIEECPDRLLRTSIVCSTGTYVDDALFHSRIPYLLAEYKKHNSETIQLDDCKYKRNGICNNITCVDYGLNCLSPATCKKQHR